MKANLALVGTSLAFAAFALALIFAAPVKADPIGDFFDALFAASPATSLDRYSVASLHGGQSVLASYYGGGGRERLNAHTANGERFNPNGFTAAHRTLPFGVRLSVCFRGCATVRVNDRGPGAWTGRSLDLSRGAARAIGLIGVGVARVRVAQLGDWQ